MSVKIFSIDDDHDFLDLIKMYFNTPERKNTFQIVGQCCKVGDDIKVNKLLENILLSRPDVVLVDFDFYFAGRPHDFGLSIIQKITEMEKDFQVRIIALFSPDESDNREEEKLHKSFILGATAYLNKEDTRRWDECILETFQAIPESTLINNREKEILTHLSNDCPGSEIHQKMSGISHYGVRFHINNLRVRFKTKTLHGMVSKAYRLNVI